jgi:hypothetical protein
MIVIDTTGKTISDVSLEIEKIISK